MRKHNLAQTRFGSANHSRKVIIIFVITLFFLCHPFPAKTMVLKPGIKNQVVLQVQEWLLLLGYLKHKPTGYYGPLTVQAVKEFQAQQNITVDGVVGRQTLSLLRGKICQTFRTTNFVSLDNSVSFDDTAEKITGKYDPSVTDLLTFNSIPSTDHTQEGNALQISQSTLGSFSDSGELLPWEQVKQIFPIGDTARVLDLETGLSFRIHRHGGHLHADCEPFSPKDTAIMFAIFDGKWSWERRSVIVEVGEHRIAGSINGQPHGRYTLRDNNFPGHFCVHFYQSRLHKNGKIDPTHQRMILKAAGNKESKDL